MHELLQAAIHIGLKINRERFGLHKEEQGWFVVNKKGQYLSNGLWSGVGRDHFATPTEAYNKLIEVNPVVFEPQSSVSM